ncbi:MAG: hypothetical protein J7642_16370 [Cyanobacteria bacterium SBC]|nr:hypothetical protein [Cyanobacteria bacterium SBC]
MILGMAHLALSVSSIEEGKKRLENRGFNCIFLERSAINHPAKKHLLEHHQPSHEIALFHNSNINLSIEIINHGHVCYTKRGSYQLKNDCIELCTSDFEKEKNFWIEGLGFREESENLLNFSSIVPRWSCKIKLIENPKIQPTTLDSQGYPCLAFFTNSLARDLDLAKQVGAYDLTEIFELCVNNKTLNIALFRTPGSAICELIQPQR